MKILIALFLIFNSAYIALAATKCYSSGCSIWADSKVNCSADTVQICPTDNDYVCGKATISSSNFDKFHVKHCVQSSFIVDLTKQLFCGESSLSLVTNQSTVLPSKPRCVASLCNDDLCNYSTTFSSISVTIITCFAILTWFISFSF